MDAAYGNERNVAQVINKLITRLAEVERERDEAMVTVTERDTELLRVRTTGHAAAHELDNIAVECGMGHSPASGDVAKQIRTLTRQVKVLREASENMHSFIVVMYGKPDGSVPEIVTTPLGISVKLGQIVAKALAALTSEGAER